MARDAAGRLPDVPEGYALVQAENGDLLLRKKRQRNLQKLGIGGFQVRRPWARVKDKVNITEILTTIIYLSSSLHLKIEPLFCVCVCPSVRYIG